MTIIPGMEGPSGPGRPRFLLSEVQRAPYDEDPPIFHKDDGLVHQRQNDILHNIWWINLASPWHGSSTINTVRPRNTGRCT